MLVEQRDYSVFRDNLRRIMEHQQLSAHELENRSRHLGSTSGAVTAHTVKNILSGKTKPQARTIRVLEELLQCDISNGTIKDDNLGPQRGVADDRYGGYTFAEYENLIGHYLFFRRSFDYTDRYVCSFVHIKKSAAKNCFSFKEVQRNTDKEGETHSYAFEGDVYIPGNFQIVQLRSGSSKMRRVHNLRSSFTERGKMLTGILNALREERFEGLFFPAVSAVYGTSTILGPESAMDQIGSFEESELPVADIPKRLEKVRSRSYF